ncbi:MAG: hypothetical protein C4K58_06455 [Flavobacteriaceae bacterium]|nr:MAG: hypothetical protein C4K58_06455 [Flavobacteriaceae bacterium]
MVFAQNIQEIDSLSQVMCRELEKTNPNDLPQERLGDVFEKVIVPYVEMQPIKIQGQVMELFYFRSQRVCGLYLDLLSEALDSPTPMKRVKEEPVSTISQQDLDIFKQNKRFWYRENDGTKTKVTLSGGNWKSNYSDGTKSLYSLHWISSNRFEVAYIKSNNHRSKMNLVGDKYQYKILSRNGSEFTLCEWVEGMNKYSIFTLNL